MDSGRFLRRLAIGLTAVLTTAALTAPATGTEVLTAVDLGGLETRTAALILSGQEAGELETSVLAIPLPSRLPAPGGVAVALVVDVGGASLLAGVGAGEDHLVTEVYAYAFDAEGRLRATLTQAFRLDLGSHRDALAAGGVKFLGRLDLEPGEHALRVLVLHRRSGRFRLRIVPLSVPAREGPTLAPPLVPEPADRWIVVRQASGSARPLPFPLATGGGTWVPATWPRLAAGTASELYLLGRGLDLGLRAHVLAAGASGGRELAELGLGDLRPVSSGLEGVEMLAAELRIPDLAAGDYVLRISAGPAAATLPLVVPPSAAELDLRTELESPAASGQPATEPDPSASGGVERARAAYVEALARLGAEDAAGARLVLVELESAAVRAEVASHAPDLEQRLLRDQAAAALELAGGRAESFVPLIWLHEQLFQQYHRHRRYLLATHSRNALSVLTDAYLQASGRSPEARRLAGAAWASVGGYFQELGDKVGATKAYRQALEYELAEEAALIGLATVHESLAQYEEAADLLARYLEWRPGDPHARLRLAVNQRRLGKSRRVLEHLRACVDDRSRSDWVTAVAYQELAALDAEEGRLEEALAVLTEASERLPGQQRLQLQMAAILDRMDRPAEARKVIARLDAGAGREHDSPRLRYSQRPTEDLLRSRRLLAEEARRRLPPAAMAAAEGGRSR